MAKANYGHDRLPNRLPVDSFSLILEQSLFVYILQWNINVKCRNFWIQLVGRSQNKIVIFFLLDKLSVKQLSIAILQLSHKTICQDRYIRSLKGIYWTSTLPWSQTLLRNKTKQFSTIYKQQYCYAHIKVFSWIKKKEVTN